MQARWNALSLELPDGRDDSALVVVDPAEPPAWNFTLRHEALQGVPFATYVAGLGAPEGVVVDGRSERQVAGRSAVVLEQHLRADRQTLKQWQAVVDDGTQAILLTMTAKDSHAVVARAAFDRALTSLTLGTP
jgi:hypothetical protein